MRLTSKASIAIEDADWCDWDARGRLLVASDTSLRILDGASREELWRHDLSSLAPDPHPAPAWAQTYGAKRA